MSKEKYYLRYKDTVIGYFEEEKDTLDFTPTADSSLVPNDLGYPLGLFPAIEKRANLKPNKSHLVDRADINRWLSDRVFPKDRQGAHTLLRGMKLNSYDMWEIAKKTKAISFNDFYWISDSLEDKYDSVHPRAKKKRSVLRPRKKTPVSREVLVRPRKPSKPVKGLQLSIGYSAPKQLGDIPLNWEVSTPTKGLKIITAYPNGKAQKMSLFGKVVAEEKKNDPN